MSIADNQIVHLPASIGALSSLSSLWMDHNQLSALPPTIGQLCNLQSMAADFNQLTTLPNQVCSSRCRT
eukprot:322374-Rhodomonas_salina.1